MSNFHNKRKSLIQRFIVNRVFQIKFSFIIVSISTLITAVFSYLYYQNEISKTELLSIQSIELNEFLQTQDSKILLYLVLFFLFQFIFVFVMGILMTHRIAGPIHRLKDYFDHLASGGEPKQLGGIRSSDEFQDFFEAIQKYNTLLLDKSDETKN